ncbi:hypothetical protein CAPTEDRAFT_125114 [Capitella teleta]|uniref:G-protein coupled receptors family 1 profile domain-containing protein n=1 Tax=Capitella teleta TaxID=283909 RepID=R7U071_CAPTE|nr:hypothetical protein CAPTEDRAFT_125114 [Capitella teleta]|eukprot:ELT97061.1 hypothetical protein CAPTEDRAFT_125114 [Capitella teleta]
MNSTNSSVSNTTTSPEVGIIPLSAYIVPVVFSFIFLVGVVGNSLVIFIILRHRAMRTTPNIFIGSLALGDLLLLLVSVPFYGMIYTHYDWPYGEFLCKVKGFLLTQSLGVSVFMLTVLAVNRYITTMIPNRQQQSPRRTLLTAAAVWILVSAVALWEGYLRHVTTHYLPDRPPLRICHSLVQSTLERPSGPCVRVCIRFAVFFLIPLLIIGVLYALMARRLWSGHLDLQMQPFASQTSIESGRKISIIVLSMAVIFTICWLPRHSYMIWFHCPSHGDYNLFWHVLKITSYCLCFINSCVNPVLLYLISARFRRHFNFYFGCRWRSERLEDLHSPDNDSTGTTTAM